MGDPQPTNTAGPMALTALLVTETTLNVLPPLMSEQLTLTEPTLEPPRHSFVVRPPPAPAMMG